MQVNISSRRTVVSDRLQDLTRSKIERLARYVPGLDRADVHFSEEQNPRIADKEICEARAMATTYAPRSLPPTPTRQSIWPPTNSNNSCTN